MATGNQNSNLVTAAKPRTAAGSIFSAPRTATVPTDPFSPLGPEFVSLGYLSEDGITNGVETDSETITAFGGDTVLTIKTSHQENFTFRPIEKNAAVLAETWGQDNVEEVDDPDKGKYLKVAHTSQDADDRIYVIELSLNAGRVERLVIPNGKVTEIGENAMVHTDAQGHELTISASTDESGVTAYEYIAKVADAVDPNNPTLSVKSTGSVLGLDLSTLGDVTFDGESFEGTVAKVNCPNWGGDGQPKESHFIYFDVRPTTGAKVWKTPGMTKVQAKAIDDGFVLCDVGEEEVTVNEVHILGADGSEHTYAVNVTASE